MRSIWPHAYLPKEKRALLVETSSVSVMGAFAFAAGLDESSGLLSATGVFVMCGSFAIGAQRYLLPTKRWYVNVLQTAYVILHGCLLYMLARTVEEPLWARWVGAAVFVLWTLVQSYMAWFLWRTGDREAGEDSAAEPMLSGEAQVGSRRRAADGAE